MYCNRCGAALSAGAQYCTGCGERVLGVAPTGHPVVPTTMVVGAGSRVRRHGGVAGGLVDGERSAAAAGDFVVFAAGAVVFAEFFGPPHLGRLGFAVAVERLAAGVGVDVDRDGTRCVRRSASDSGVGFVRAHAVGATAGIGDRVFGNAAISAGNGTGNLHPVGAAAGDERAGI